jgi:biopolymer transport protein ExbB
MCSIYGFGSRSHLALLVVLASASAGHAAEEAEAVVVNARPLFFRHMLVSNGIIFGPLMLLLALVLAGLILYMIFGLRRGRALGRELMPRLSEAAGAGPERLAELTRDDRSFLGQAVAAGIARLPHGLEEARHAVATVLERVRTPRERALRWLIALGILSPLLGLLGTFLGMTLLFMDLGYSKVQISQPMLMLGLSHASCVLLEGLFLAAITVPTYVICKNRLQNVMLATGSAADELLTRAHG